MARMVRNCWNGWEFMDMAKWLIVAWRAGNGWKSWMAVIGWKRVKSQEWTNDILVSTIEINDSCSITFLCRILVLDRKVSLGRISPWTLPPPPRLDNVQTWFSLPRSFSYKTVSTHWKCPATIHLIKNKVTEIQWWTLMPHKPLHTQQSKILKNYTG